MPGPTALVALLAVLVLAIAGWRLSGAAAERVERWWAGRWAPLALGVVTMLALGWVGGGGLQMTPISTDENAYLLEARLLAHGRVAGAPAPIPEFFEQPWVVVTPRTFAKYPPGQSLTLAPGVALGSPWLMPALLLVVTGALVFALARRLVGAGGALLAWSGWVLAPITMQWQSSYFSEVTSAASWLVAAWASLRWHEEGRRRWLLLAAAAIGWAALTRPFTALLLGLPLGAGLLPTLLRRRAWVDAGWACAIVIALLAILPVWNHATTGRWGESPLSLYTRTYLPWDRLGFAIDSTPPLRAPSADFAPIAHHLVQVHHEHTLAALPETLATRAEWVARQTFSGWRLLLVPLALIGLLEIGTLGWVAVASGVLLFLGHAVWGHEAGWTLYYAETVPVW
ncbi:MAG: glycosyltransferase family 39 protein, partial [Gemmatimonadetes bacterium]|nr:glycosyltransferase family 39 protein [Gemmatimonadota bacterium]